MSATSTLGSRLITIGLGLIIAAGGAFFCRYLWRDYQTAKAMDAWIETPCEVIVSTVDDSERTQRGAIRYRLEIRYRYEFGGKDYFGEKVKRNRPVASSDPDQTGSVQRLYPVGSKTVCFVNPEAPEDAILERNSKAALYSIWFPALFVVGGLGIAWGGIRPWKRKR